jgi:hypothetical protein
MSKKNWPVFFESHPILKPELGILVKLKERDSIFDLVMSLESRGIGI